MPSTYSGGEPGRNKKRNWAEEARASGLPVFPIRITRRDGRWDKIPLIENWVEAANYFNLLKFDPAIWDKANGYGILMGPRSGLYALDIDAYKEGCDAEQWMKDFGVPAETRTHGTISGGLHKIYALSNAWKSLRTRANVVPGLDTRGEGGFIAFGEGYTMLDDRYPALLPTDACVDLAEGADAERLGKLPVWRAPTQYDHQEFAALLKQAIASNQSLRRRWAGDAEGMDDTTRSALDQAVAFLLTSMGFTNHQVMMALLMYYEHGAARWKSPTVGLRAAQRCAARAMLSVRKATEDIREFMDPDNSTDEEDVMNQLIEGMQK